MPGERHVELQASGYRYAKRLVRGGAVVAMVEELANGRWIISRLDGERVGARSFETPKSALYWYRASLATPPAAMDDATDEILHRFEADQRAKTESVRELLREAGRPDLVAELDANLREVANGRASARSTWAALSNPQRAALETADRYGSVQRRSIKPCSYGPPDGRPLPPRPFRLLTVRNLISRELLACDGGAFDPERVLAITERGRFVLAVAKADANA